MGIFIIAMIDAQQVSPFLNELFGKERLNIEWLVNRVVAANISTYSSPQCLFHPLLNEPREATCDMDTKVYLMPVSQLSQPSFFLLGGCFKLL